MKVSLIVAMARNRVIGRDNSLIWHLPADLRHFKETTMGQPVIMGRKTYESVGKPLPGRINIIVTRRKGYSAEGCLVAGSLEEAIRMAEEAVKKNNPLSPGSNRNEGDAGKKPDTGSRSGKEPEGEYDAGKGPGNDPGNAGGRIDEIFIAGGGQIYREGIPLADRMYITVIDEDFEGDTHFPPIAENEWVLIDEKHHPADERNPHSMTFLTWERGRPAT